VKTLLFTDPHFHAFPAFARLDPTTGITNRVKEGLDTLDWLVNLAVEEEEVDSVICLGDVFDRPGFLDPVVASEVQSRFQRFCDHDLQLVTVGGNHDVAGSHHSSIGILPGTRVWEKNQSLYISGLRDHVIMIPWTRTMNPAKDLDDLQLDSSGIMMGHFIAHDVEVATGHRVHGIEGVSRDWLDRFDLVVLGDAHKRQEIGNTVYPGSVLKTSFNDDGESGWACVISGKDHSIEWLRNPASPYFLRLSPAVRPIDELMDWIEEVVLKADPNGAAVYLDLQATKKEAAKVQKRFGETTLKLRTRVLTDTEKGKATARIQTTSTAGPTDIVKKYVAAKATEAPADPEKLVEKGQEYIG